MEGPTSASFSSLLDEDALLDIVIDVWGGQTPPSSPSHPFYCSNTTEEDDTTPSSSTDQEQEQKFEKPKKKRRRDRNRPWHEIARLQSGSQELEQQGQLAKASKRARGALYRRNDNAQLKTKLQESIKDICSLEQNLLHQMDEIVQAFPSSLVMTTRALPFDLVENNAVFTSMAESVDNQYRDMSRVLRRAGLDGMTSEVVESYASRINSVYTGGELGDVLKFRARVLTPFTRSTLEKALWCGIEAGGGVTIVPVESTCGLVLPLTIASRVAVQKYEISMGDNVCTMRMVIKQFVENHRVVQVWNMLADWPRVGTLRNVKTQEYGWGYIQPVGENSIVSVGCILMTPTVYGRPPSETCESITNLTGLYQNMVMSRLQGLENQTMDQIVREKKLHPAYRC